MAATPHDGSGTTLTFPGFTGSVTNITYNLTDVNAADTIDISHLGLTAGAAVLTQTRPLKGSADDTGREVSIEYVGNGVIADGSTGTLSISGGLTLSAVATVASSSVTLAVNDVTRGNVTFRVAR
jgi:hypothetical protein